MYIEIGTPIAGVASIKLPHLIADSVAIRKVTTKSSFFLHTMQPEKRTWPTPEKNVSLRHNLLIDGSRNAFLCVYL